MTGNLKLLTCFRSMILCLPKLKFVKDHLCSSCDLRKAKRIKHQMSTARTPEQNGIVERWNRTLVEAARTILSAAKVPLFFWAKAISTTCFTQNRSLGNDVLTACFRSMILCLPKLKFVKDHLCSFCDLRKAKRIKHQMPTARTPKQNGVVKRWNRTLVEAARTILSAAKVPLLFWAKAISTAYFTQSRSLVIPRHEKTLYHIINGRKPSIRFFHIFGSLCYIVRDDIPSLNIQTTPKTTSQAPTQTPTVNPTKNINQAETPKENAQVKEDEFINIFSTLVQERGEISSRYVDSSNMHTFYQRNPSEHRWKKDHPLEQVIGNPS
nr:retrovirus-related Pol polyprotein from transposon TNT 1-94 [Tanacetum cinerariifolium]